MEIWHNPRCGKSREALQLLEEKGIKVTVREYLKDLPTKAELKELIHKIGIKPYDLVRKNEEIFKTQYKGKELNDEEWIEAMIANPKLIERPIVIKDNKAIVGRPPVLVLDLE